MNTESVDHRRGIAVAGSLIIDHYKSVDVYPEHSSLTTIREVHSTTGGLASNCAIDLARLDPELNIPVLGLVGDDEDGQYVLETLARYTGIDLSGVGRMGRTSFTDVLEDRANHTRTFFQFRGANAEFGPEHIDVDNLEADILHIGYILLLDALDAPHPTDGTQLAEVLRRCRERGIQTSIDIVTEDSDRFRTLVPPALAYTNYCIINEVEASRTTGIEATLGDDGNIDVYSLIPMLKALRAMGVEDWVCIHWRHGAIGQRADGTTEYRPALSVPRDQIRSTTGAGDAFLSGTLYAAWRGEDLGTALEAGIATAAASLTHQSASEGVIGYDDALAYYQRGPHHVNSP